MHQREAASINQSLLSLSRCITALAQLQRVQQQQQQQQQHQAHAFSLSSPVSRKGSAAAAAAAAHPWLLPPASPSAASSIASSSEFASPSSPASVASSDSLSPRHSEGSLNSTMTSSALQQQQLAGTGADPLAALPHIPYRTSKLTMLLKDSLGGNSRTLLVACIRPEAAFMESTLSTLRFAALLKRIRNIPVVNEEPRDGALRKLQEENQRLQREVAAMQQDLLTERSERDRERVAPPAVAAMNARGFWSGASSDGDPVHTSAMAAPVDLDALFAPWTSEPARSAMRRWVEAGWKADTSAGAMALPGSSALSKQQVQQLLSFLPSATTDSELAAGTFPSASSSSSSSPSVSAIWLFHPSGLACSSSLGLSPRRLHRKLLTPSVPHSQQRLPYDEQITGGRADEEEEQEQQPTHSEEKMEDEEEAEEPTRRDLNDSFVSSPAPPSPSLPLTPPTPVTSHACVPSLLSPPPPASRSVSDDWLGSHSLPLLGGATRNNINLHATPPSPSPSPSLTVREATAASHTDPWQQTSARSSTMSNDGTANVTPRGDQTWNDRDSSSSTAQAWSPPPPPSSGSHAIGSDTDKADPIQTAAHRAW